MAVPEAGHAAAREIDDLYRIHAGEIYRYAFAVLGDRADAEDVTQTTFLNAYRSLERGVRPRKPSNWLLTIASNEIKQRFRSERSRPRNVVLDDRVVQNVPDEATLTMGELLAALARIPPVQCQAIVLREFEGRSYDEIAEILDVTTSALETLLFRARKSLAEELDSQLTCTDAQLALSRAVDRRIGRKERRRLREHLGECLDCARFAEVQQRYRRALRGLTVMPIPVSLTLFSALEKPAVAATLPTAGAGVTAAGTGGAAGVATVAAAGGAAGGGIALKAAAVVTAASVAGGAGVVGAADVERQDPKREATVRVERPGERLGQVAPRGVTVPGRGVAAGRTTVTERPGKRIGQLLRRAGPKSAPVRAAGRENRDAHPGAPKAASKERSAEARTKAHGKVPPVKKPKARARGRESEKPAAREPAVQSSGGGDGGRGPQGLPGR